MQAPLNLSILFLYLHCTLTDQVSVSSIFQTHAPMDCSAPFQATTLLASQPHPLVCWNGADFRVYWGLAYSRYYLLRTGSIYNLAAFSRVPSMAVPNQPPCCYLRFSNRPAFLPHPFQKHRPNSERLPAQDLRTLLLHVTAANHVFAFWENDLIMQPSR